MNYSIFEDTMVDMNWMEIEEKGKANVPVLFPLGVIEEHGPHLPMGTDIYWSYAVCKKIKEALNTHKKDCLIAPPCYWGINHCTGSFSGTFSVKRETMNMILTDTFENLNQFGFKHVYCMNSHGDPLHVDTILNSIKNANEKFDMNIRLLMEPYDLASYGLSGDEDYIMLNNAKYPSELYVEEETEERDLLDIHAGSLETAVMAYFYPDAVRKEIAIELQSYSLTKQGLSVWLSGGEDVKRVAPLGYAGNPAGYEKKLSIIKPLFDILVNYYAQKISEFHVAE